MNTGLSHMMSNKTKKIALEVLNEISEIINASISIKVKRALLREKFDLSEKTMDELCPMTEVEY